MVIWITGITASGKTTLSKMLEKKLIENGYKEIILLDGDTLRNKGQFKEGHSLEIRLINFELLMDLINTELKKNKIVIVSTVSHLKHMRIEARKRLNDYIEIFLDCNPLVCEQRDYKNLYKKAKNRSLLKGEIFPGITEPYQRSENPELIINTELDNIDKCFDKLYKFCLKRIKKSREILNENSLCRYEC